VADLPRDVLEDPIARRSITDKGRDGCRVPLPWTPDGPSFGFGAGDAHLPQPDWLSSYAVNVQEHDPDSTLNLYRRALALRRDLFAGTEMNWVDSEPSVLYFERPGDVGCVTNFGAEPITLPDGEVLLSSLEPADGQLPSDATAWLRMR
jgi:alpha-glucosidase